MPATSIVSPATPRPTSSNEPDDADVSTTRSVGRTTGAGPTCWPTIGVPAPLTCRRPRAGMPQVAVALEASWLATTRWLPALASAGTVIVPLAKRQFPCRPSLNVAGSMVVRAGPSSLSHRSSTGLSLLTKLTLTATSCPGWATPGLTSTAPTEAHAHPEVAVASTAHAAPATDTMHRRAFPKAKCPPQRPVSGHRWSVSAGGRQLQSLLGRGRGRRPGCRPSGQGSDERAGACWVRAWSCCWRRAAAVSGGGRPPGPAPLRA